MPRAKAFTLVELLVALSTIGLLVALLLPALLSSFETSRQAQCRNNLKQLVASAVNCEAASGNYPTGGWGAGWTGDPDFGNRIEQPGGWVFNLLPYLEKSPLRISGRFKSAAEKKSQATWLASQPLPLLNCPSRRAAAAYPFDSRFAQHYGCKAYNFDHPLLVARSDYAMNAGDSGSNHYEGPTKRSAGLSPEYRWPSDKYSNGLVAAHRTYKPRDVLDGLSNVFLFGEKYANPELYETGRDPGDCRHMYVGLSAATVRMTAKDLRPLPDRPGLSRDKEFGSAHPTALHFAFCDGSVRAIAYGIDPIVYGQTGNRRDGLPLGE